MIPVAISGRLRELRRVATMVNTMVYTMVYTIVPSWSGGFCEGPLLTRGIRRILMVRRILGSDFAVKTEKKGLTKTERRKNTQSCCIQNVNYTQGCLCK
jgi:hypothetical protein